LIKHLRESDRPSIEQIVLLIKLGTDLNLIDDSGNTALDYAIMKYSITIEVVQLLLNLGADCNKINKHGENSLMKYL